MFQCALPNFTLEFFKDDSRLLWEELKLLLWQDIQLLLWEDF